MWGTGQLLFIRKGEGFLSTMSRNDLQSKLDGSVTNPDDSSLDPELQESLNDQLHEDVRAAFVDSAIVQPVSDYMIFKRFGFTPILED